MTNPIHAAVSSVAAQVVPTTPTHAAAAVPRQGAQIIQVSQAAAIVSISSESKNDAPNIEKKTDAQFGADTLENDEGGKGGGGGDEGDNDEETPADETPQKPILKKRLDVSA